ncbi:MAG: DUF5675 family protein [Sphaerochaetaceae bacterium]
MRLQLFRDIYRPDRTLGKLYMDGHFFCYTLEDTVRPAGVKIPHQTAIPAGIYAVIVTISPRFQKRLPLLLNVPNFGGILMHGGNGPGDTSGCILVAFNCDPVVGKIWNRASEELTRLIDKAFLRGEKCSVEITNAKPCRS